MFVRYARFIMLAWPLYCLLYYHFILLSPPPDANKGDLKDYIYTQNKEQAKTASKRKYTKGDYLDVQDTDDNRTWRVGQILKVDVSYCPSIMINIYICIF